MQGNQKQLWTQGEPIMARLEDHGIATCWDVKDGERILKTIRKISLAKEKKDHMTALKLGLMLDRNFERLSNDQTATDDDGYTLEPYDVGSSDDLVTNGGLARVAALATGDSDKFFSHFASGTGTKGENRADRELDEENARVPFGQLGYQLGAGTSMKFVGFFPTTTESALITEGAVFDNEEEGQMLFRTKYNTTLTHIKHETVYALSQSILFNAILEEGLVL